VEAHVRTATTGDAGAVARLFALLKRHHQELAPANPRYGLDEDTWSRLAQADMVDPNVTVLVAEVDGEVRAFAKLILEDKPWGLGCEVETLIVDEQLRGRGIGSLLMGAVEQEAAEAGAVGIRVNVLRLNEQGRNFYERLDYEPIAVRYGKPLNPVRRRGGSEIARQQPLGQGHHDHRNHHR
jgi:ribosomal protein S18 acetylase RimI-like enzyme